MKKNLTTILIASTVCLSGYANAADETKANAWHATAEVGYVSTTGNTETNTLNIKGSASTDRAKWKHKIDLTVLSSSDAIQTTAERYLLTGQSNYKLTAPNYLFGLVSYEDDKFNGYDYQVTEAVGFGRRVIDETNLSLDLEIGPGAKQSTLDSGESTSETVIRAGAKLDWTISKTSELTEDLTIESGEDTTVTKSVTGVTTKMADNLSMKVTYTYKNDSDPVTAEGTDTETAVTLVYTF